MKYFLIGNPLGHSISPYIHTRLFEYDNVSAEYTLYPIPEEKFKGFTQNIHEKKEDFSGFNITIPYKQRIIPFLDGLSDEAKAIGAVNTVVLSYGGLVGHNTDYYGLVKALEYIGAPLYGRVLLLGCGGAGLTALYAVQKAGGDITVALRNPDKLLANVKKIPLDNVTGDYDLVINATPIGMYPNIDDSPVDWSNLSARYAYDLVYNPENTKFLFGATEQGAVAANGMRMLVYQAVRAHELWLPRKRIAYTDEFLTELVRDTEFRLRG
ncbi:MAG: shikimate dehydrogenase [Oscillospiraceae bacterium]|jgi:shikimate dehydrogenase|nr:shikimate dehydrogenase [Oscillospiraceae bacterium]